MRPRSLPDHPAAPTPTAVEITVPECSPAALPPVRAQLEQRAGVVVRGLWSAAHCAALTRAVYAAREHWTPDFGGEQFALGRAFYTHLETGRAAEYFAHSAASDARVEAALPGTQAAVRALFGQLVGARVRPRRGFGGPGVHVFPSGAKVARRGGVPHWDVEGLAPEHLARHRCAATLVVMLQPPARGGALRLWDSLWNGLDEPTAGALRGPTLDVRSNAGDALLLSSYRLHQIRPFTGGLDRVSVTAHGVEVDTDVWDVWF